jgi:hypothetical protein
MRPLEWRTPFHAPLHPRNEATVTLDSPKIRSVLATRPGHPRTQWICHPTELGSDYRICGVCRKQQLKPFAAECPNCRAVIV